MAFTTIVSCCLYLFISVSTEHVKMLRSCNHNIVITVINIHGLRVCCLVKILLRRTTIPIMVHCLLNGAILSEVPVSYSTGHSRTPRKKTEHGASTARSLDARLAEAPVGQARAPGGTRCSPGPWPRHEQHASIQAG